MLLRNPYGEPIKPTPEFDIIDGRRPRGGGFVSIGEVVRPMVARLALHLADEGVIDQQRADQLQDGKPHG